MDEERPPRVSWTSNRQIAKLLDVSTAACTRCGSAARVPEDVVAVRQSGMKRTPIVICGECQPEYARLFREMIGRFVEQDDEET